MEKHGLKGPFAVYFTTMYRFPQGVTSVQLCELCSRDKADVSRAMTVLQQKGLVIRESLNQNCYNALLKLTEEGRQLARHINQKAKTAVEYGGRGLSPEHREIFYHALELISSNLQTLSLRESNSSAYVNRNRADQTGSALFFSQISKK